MKKPSKPKAKKKAVKKAVSSRKKTTKVVTAVKAAKNHGMHDARDVVKERRYAVRLLATQVTFAGISLTSKGFGGADYTFNVQLSGLLVDSSPGGCSLVFMRANPLSAGIERGAECVVQLSPQPPRRAVVRWVKTLDQRLVNAGFEFL